MASQDFESSHIGGRYDVDRRLGAGATAIVYSARDKGSGNTVAVKILRKELAESGAAERFLKEIRRTAKLEHPVILPVLDSGEHEGRPYFVMPYMEGGTLRQRLERTRQLPMADVIAIARKIAEALDHANERGLIHRDVKPENILFTKGEARLADFGIARALQAVYGDGTTSSATIRGTPAYMSPEQASGSDHLDGRSDQYSLACVVYEMIAGMQAFIGPTPEAVMAQRFKHTPRDVSVYRPTAPAGLGPVMAKAFALAPADRFARCADFVEALASAPESLPFPEPGTRPNRRMIAAAGATLLVVAIGVATQLPGIGRGPAATDSTRVALLPLVVEGSVTRPWRDDDLLREALSRWRGISVVDQYLVADAVRRHGAVETLDDASQLAVSLGAGRFVRGRISAAGAAWRATLSLYNAQNSTPLYEHAEPIPGDLVGATAAYARLADSLLLRGAAADSVPGSASGFRSLPAVQAFSRAQSALDDWDLAKADSAFELAVGLDPEYAHASLWLAQVRAWRDLPRREWATVAERASAMSGQLSVRDRRLAAALVALANEEYERACATYDSLRLQNDRDFAAWFGLGKCRTMDRAVVADRSSPSGYRFRMSRHQAMLAYGKAFEILPSVHRGYERGAFERLQDLLLVSTGLKPGRGLTDGAQFLARPAWLGDTLALIPYPWNAVYAGDSATVPAGMARALSERRTEFRRIAASWSAAFPRAAGAKYAVALSLELLGDPRAVDTLRLARDLSSDNAYRSRLAMSEVLWLVKFGVPDDLASLRRASDLADTLLRSNASWAGEDADVPAAVAALTGRCDDTSRLLSASARPEYGASAELFREAATFLVHSLLKCSRTARVSVSSLAERVSREFRAASEAERTAAEGMWLFRPLLFGGESPSGLLARVAKSTSNDVLVAAAALAASDSAAARSALTRIGRQMNVTLPTPEMSLATAELWLRLGDSVRAARALDESLTNARAFDLNALDEAPKAAAFAIEIRTRAALARAAGDAAGAARWRVALQALWSGADTPLRVQDESNVAIRTSR